IPIPWLGYKDPVRVCLSCNIKLDEYKTVREVVILRRTQTVQVYNVVEYGRRYYRTLVFTTDSRYGLYTMPPRYIPTEPWTRADRLAACENVEHLRLLQPSSSLVVMRNFDAETTKHQ
ncbi:hypothetical protein SARC_15764, partial [Sphaeroforma arctica JP610]